MEFLRKARARGIDAPNIICWLCLSLLTAWGKLWGTMRLYCKGRLLGVNVGSHVRAHGQVGLMRWPGGKIVIGDNVSIISSWRRATACALNHPTRLRVFGPGAVIEISEGAQLSGASITARSRRIHIGKNALLGPNCIVVDSDFHAPWPPERRIDSPGYENDADVFIGDYVWIGMNCTILKGVHIGAGAIIGASSVVTRDVPPNCVVCGAPARVVRMAEAEHGNAGK